MSSTSSPKAVVTPAKSPEGMRRNTLILDSDAARREAIALALQFKSNVIECSGRKQALEWLDEHPCEYAGIIRDTRSFLTCVIVAQSLSDFGAMPNDWRGSEGLAILPRLVLHGAPESKIAKALGMPTQVLVVHNLPLDNVASFRGGFMAAQLGACDYLINASPIQIAESAASRFEHFDSFVIRNNRFFEKT